MSELISGRDALNIYIDDRDGVLHIGKTFSERLEGWELCHAMKVDDFLSDKWVFKINPKTIKIELEIPAPFEPKDGEMYYFLNSYCGGGYDFMRFRENEDYTVFGAWRTEEEIKKVVAALRSIKK